MTETAASRSTPTHPASGRSLRARFATVLKRHPSAAAFLLYGAVAVVATGAAFGSIFTQFAPWDDEGTLLTMLNAFVHGDVLYRDVYSPYGPFYYEIFGGLFALTGEAVSTDASRLLVIAVWVTTSLLYGLAVQRLTGLLTLGVAGMVVAFGALSILVNEPMHPQGLVVLLLGAFTLLVVGESRRPIPAGMGAGALLAMLVLTKLNVGCFAVAAVAFAAVLAVPPLYERRWLRWLVVAAFLAMPAIVMLRDWRLEWVRDFAALEIISASAVVVAAGALKRSPDEDRDSVSKWLLAAAAGFALAFAVIVGIILLTGTTPADVFDGIVVQALRIRDAYVVPFLLPPAAVGWGIVSLAAAVVTSRTGGRDGTVSPLWPGSIRVVAGLAIWFTVTNAAPFTLNPAANDVTLPLVLAWLAASPPRPVATWTRFLRTLIAALAVGQVLQAYPVAGSQVGISSVSFVAVGAICIADGLNQIREWSAGRGTEAFERMTRITGAGVIALAGVLAYSVLVRPAMTNAVKYHEQMPLPFADSSLLRLPPPEVETYERLVTLITRYGCTTIVGYPSVNSLYLWSSVDPPKPGLPGPWIKLMDSSWQRRALDEVRDSPRPCVIRNDNLAEFWLQGVTPSSAPLVRYAFREFGAVQRVGDFQFLLPKARSIHERRMLRRLDHGHS